MTKADFVKVVKAKFNENEEKKIVCTNRIASDAIDAVFASISDMLAAGEDVKIPGFCTFSTYETSDRNGRNPQTGEAITIKGRKVVKFKPSSVLKKVVAND